MKIVISVGGKFHAFELARQLFKRGHLERLITSYPKSEGRKYGIPQEKIKSILIKEIIERGWQRLPKFLRYLYNPQYLIHSFYDRLAGGRLTPCDLCAVWGNFGLRTMKKAKQLGALTVIDHGGSHIVYQKNILKEEYERFGVEKAMPYQLPHPKIVEMAIQEYEEADYISVPSLFAKKTFLEKRIAEKKLSHVPYGVNISEFRAIPREDNVFRVVFVGGMTLQKGVHYLLQAFSELKLKNAELLLVGSLSDEMKPFFKKYEGNYKWVGHVPQSELHKYYSQGSVFVLNSIQDGFGMVIIQAMACGLPVIATTNTGGPDIIENGVNGFIIPIRGVDALKDKILYLYENPDRCRQMGQSAKERVATGFTWDDYGDRITREYQRIFLSCKN